MKKKALVTGASRGIGKAIALELSRKGYDLVLSARDFILLSQLKETISLMPEPKGNCLAIVPLDMSCQKSINIAIAQIWRDWGPIDLLINCAGVAHQSNFLESDSRKFQSEIEINLIGTLLITKVMAKRMANRGSGSIVNVSSLMGHVAAPTWATYSATKFALIGFTHALRSELMDLGVRVSALLPPLVQTSMTEKVQQFRWASALSPELVAEALVQNLDRMPVEIVVGWQAKMAVWLNRLCPKLMAHIVHLAKPQ